MSVFDETLDRLLILCQKFQDVPTDVITKAATAVLQSGNVASSPALLGLQNAWYDSLKKRKPAFSVYGDPLYIAEAWCCWIVYSRKYLKAMNSPNSLRDGLGIIESLSDAKRIVDLGCGFGHTAAAWRELIPNAEVIGTNLPGTLQYEVASLLGERFGYAMAGETPPIAADIVFCSEYFEHIPAPIDHLHDVIRTTNPRVMLIANAFGQQAIGHFVHYRVRSKWIHGKDMGRLFNKTMKRLGYRRIKTKMWNQRPALWMRA